MTPPAALPTKRQHPQPLTVTVSIAEARARILERHGKAPTPRTIQMHCQAGRIPGAFMDPKRAPFVTAWRIPASSVAAIPVRVGAGRPHGAQDLNPRAERNTKRNARADTMRAKGKTLDAIGASLNLTASTVSRILRRHE